MKNRPIENRSLIPGPAGEIEIASATWPTDQMPSATAVICHPHPLFGGSLDNKVVVTLAKAFQNKGFHTIRFNFRGVGKSAGGFGGGKGEQEDLLAVLQWLQGKRSQDKVWLAGFSFGTYVAFEVAQVWPAHGLVLVAPPVQRFDYKIRDGFNTPIVLIQGLADEIVPPAPVLDWASQQTVAITTVSLPGVGHFFHGQLTQLKTILEERIA